MELIGLLGTSLGLGIGAGVNAYATLLVFGLFARFNPAWFPGDSAQFFASTPVLVGLGVLVRPPHRRAHALIDLALAIIDSLYVQFCSDNTAGRRRPAKLATR